MPRLRRRRPRRWPRCRPPGSPAAVPRPGTPPRRRNAARPPRREPPQPVAAHRRRRVGRQVTNGLIYETLSTAATGPISPASPRAGTSRTTACALAVARSPRRAAGTTIARSACSMCRARSSRCCAAGTDAAAARADLSDVDSIELAADHVVRFILRPVRLRAARALRRPDPPRPPGAAGHRRGVALRKQPIGTGPSASCRGSTASVSASSACPRTGVRAPPLDEIVFDLDPDAVRALNRTRRGDLDVLPRVLDAHYPEQVEPATLHGAMTLYRLTPQRTRSWSSTIAGTRWAIPGFGARWRCSGIERGSPTSCTRIWRARSAARRSAMARPRDDRRAAARSPARASGARRRRLPRQRRRRRARSPGRPIRLRCSSRGQPQLHVEAHAFALEAAQGRHPARSRSRPTRRRSWRASSTGEFDLAPMIWEGQPDEDPDAALFGPDGISTTAATARARSRR